MARKKPEQEQGPETSPENEYTGQEAGQEKEEGQTREAEKMAVEELKSLEAWADELRLAAWQTAAVARMMGWAEGKLVSRREVENAVAMLSGRPQGGGRMPRV